MLSCADQAANAAELIRQELARIRASKLFLKSSVASNMLTYLVEQELAGRAGELKEMTIGLELFAVGNDYDPKLDSMVRVNANRLRARLDDYYYRNKPSAVRIVLEKGSYIPKFVFVKAAFAGDVPAYETESLPGPDLHASSPAAVLPVPSALPRRFGWLRIAAPTLGVFVLMVLLIYRQTSHRMQSPEVRRVHPFGSSNELEEFAEFSPDGQTVAFISSPDGSDRRAIYLQGVVDDDAHRVTDEVDNEARPAWSPDGKKLAYLRLTGENRKQVVLRTLADGSETLVADLKGGPLWLCGIPHLSWSPDGHSLYTSQGSPCGIVSIDLGSHVVRPLVLPPNGILGDLEAAVAPDGRFVAFVRNYGYLRSDVFMKDLTDGSLRQITHDTADVLGLAWNRDGKSLVVSSNRLDGGRRLWEVPLDGDQPRPLTDGSSSPSFPSIAANQGRIIFTQFHNISSIWKADRNGATKVVDNGGDNGTPDVSAVGRLLFSSDRSGSKTIWVSDREGQNPHRLIRDHNIPAGAAKWSPDGNRIVFECKQDGDNICLTGLQGIDVRLLTHGPASHTAPSWSRDGKSVYFTCDRSGVNEVYRQQVDSGEAMQITKGGGDQGTESPDGQWLYFRRPGSLTGIEAAAMTPAAENADRNGLEGVPKHIFDWQVLDEGILFVKTGESGGIPILSIYEPSDAKTSALLPLGGYEGSASPAFTYDAAMQTAYYAKGVYRVELSVLESKPPELIQGMPTGRE